MSPSFARIWPVSHPRDRHAAATLLLDGGKRVADTVYMHMLLVDEQPAEVRDLVMAAATLAPDADGRFCVVRIALRRPEIGLLDYPGFFEEPFPALRSSWRVELDTGRVAAVDFSARDNPPILHRKELLLPAQHPDRSRFACLTAELEDYGAFEQPLHTIGQRLQWERALASLGLKVENHQVVVGLHDSDAGGGLGSVSVARHRTAISRSRLSAASRALSCACRGKPGATRHRCRARTHGGKRPTSRCGCGQKPAGEVGRMLSVMAVPTATQAGPVSS